MIGLFIFLITFVVPRFAQLYDQLGTKLPAMTTFLLDWAERLRPTGSTLGGGGDYWFFAVSVVEDGCGGEPDRQDSDLAADVWGCLAEVSGGIVFEDAVNIADRWIAAGAVA